MHIKLSTLFYFYFFNTSFLVLTTNSDPWTLSSNWLPANPDLNPSVGNGQTASLVQYPYFHVNGIYNGHDTETTHARIPNRISFEALVPNATTTYTLKIDDGYFLYTQSNEHVTVESYFYCHRKYQTLMVKKFFIHRTKLESLQDEISLDISQFQFSEKDMALNSTLLDEVDAVLLNGSVLQVELDGAPTPQLFMVSSQVPTNFTLPANVYNFTTTFVMSVVVNNKQKAISDYKMALQMIDNITLESTHIQEWRNLWTSGIIIHGNDTVASIVYSSYYYLYSSLPIPQTDYDWPFFGMSPASLAHSDIGHTKYINGTGSYLGHIFWDQEIWMLPNIMPFHPELVRKTLSESRIRHLPAAQMKASVWGYDGAMFPWEAAYTGFEVCPWLLATKYEIHITGDIAVCLKHYLQLTDDMELATSGGGYEVAHEVAKFWASKVTKIHDNTQYGALGVMGPDEFHRGIDNSAYTNAIAREALNIPSYIYNHFNVKASKIQAFPPNSKWTTIANRMYVPFNSTMDYHPEFDGYMPGTLVTQADVILMGYPLGFPIDISTRVNDLNIYADNTDPAGPGMTWAMFAINWLELGNYSNAEPYFWKNFGYNHAPFNVWTERFKGYGAVNFITGMGGFLQAFTYGYFGLRIEAERLIINPQPIPLVEHYELLNFKYRSNVLNFTVQKNSFTVNFIVSRKDKTLKFSDLSFTKNVILRPGQSATLSNGKYYITENMPPPQPSVATTTTTTASGIVGYRILIVTFLFLLMNSIQTIIPNKLHTYFG